MEKEKTTEKVLGYLKTTKKPAKAAEIQNALKLTGGQVAGAIYRLKNEKKVQKTPSGYESCEVC